jgi:hypothetical protein
MRDTKLDSAYEDGLCCCTMCGIENGQRKWRRSFQGFRTLSDLCQPYFILPSSLSARSDALLMLLLACIFARDGMHQTNTDPPSGIRIPSIKECQPRHKHNYPLIHLIHPPLNIIPDRGPSSKHFTKGGNSNPYT